MQEGKVLAAIIQYRDAFNAVARYHTEKDFSDKAEIIYEQVALYYKRDSECSCVDTEALLARLKRKYPKHYALFEKFIDELPEVSAANVLDDYLLTKLDSLGQQAGALLLSGEHDKAKELVDVYVALRAEGLEAQEQEEEKIQVYIGAEVLEFSTTLETGNRIPIAPASLNRELKGGLIPGSHMLVYAPPETGKTAAAITMAFAGCYKGFKVLYVGNEEAKDMYLMRIMCRFAGMTEEEVQADKAKAHAVAMSRGYGNLIFVHMSPGTTDKVQALALEHEVDLVILDQLHNLNLGDGKGKQPEKTILLEKLAYTMRMFFSKHKIAGISFTQADEKAIGKLFLTIRDVYYSNIGVQGMVDVMIGIGMDTAGQQSGRRVFNFTKNKLGGTHNAVQVQLLGTKSTFIDIGQSS